MVDEGAARAEQAELYGEPLGDLISRVGAVLGLSQAQLAKVIGMSPPMLSQLGSGKRVKVGHPAVLSRLMMVRDLTDAVRAGERAMFEVPQVLEAISADAGQWSRSGAVTTATTAPGLTNVAGLVGEMRGVLRAAASERDLMAAAHLLRERHPGLADLIEVVGLGRQEDAEAHVQRLRRHT